MLNSENYGNIRWQLSLDREIELSQTNQGVGGAYVGVVPRVQSKLSHALHAHRRKSLLQHVQNSESTAIKRAMVGSGERGGRVPWHWSHVWGSRKKTR